MEELENLVPEIAGAENVEQTTEQSTEPMEQVTGQSVEPAEQNAQPEKIYTEPELNEILLRFHEDYCTLRRDMISEGLLTRDGGLYRRVL